MKSILSLIIVLLVLLTSCGEQVVNPEKINSLPPVFPDYTGVTIPASIAPLNFVLTKYSKVSFGISDSHIYKFNNYVTPNTIRSNTFTIDGYEWSIKDIPSGSYPFQQGVLAVYREVGNVVYYQSVNIGTVNYITGEVSISNLLIDSMNDLQTELSISINPGSYIDENTVFTDYNIYTNARDQLIRLNEDQITITLLVDNTK